MEELRSNKADQMLEHIAQRVSSGQTVANYCEQNGMRVSSYYYWQQKLKQEKQSGGFIKLPSLPSMSRMEVILPNGIRLCFNELIPVPYLNEVLCSI
jgi:precorrin-2 methylase